MKLRKRVEAALRGPVAERIVRVRALGPEAFAELIDLALDEGAGEVGADAAQLIGTVAPDAVIDAFITQAFAPGAFAHLAVVSGWGRRTVERVLAGYEALEPRLRFRARVVLASCGVHDERVLPLLIAGLREGDPPKILVAYGDPAGAAPIEAELRASPVRAVMSDAEVERQVDLLGALEELRGELPADLRGRSALLTALAARGLQDELHAQFDGKPRLAHAIAPAAARLPAPAGKRRG